MFIEHVYRLYGSMGIDLRRLFISGNSQLLRKEQKSYITQFLRPWLSCNYSLAIQVWAVLRSHAASPYPAIVPRPALEHE